MNKKDYYEVLGVPKTANDAEIKSSFRKKAKEYHPDVNKEADAEDKFKEIQEAYAVLSDSNKRKQYDQFGHSAFTNASGGFSGYEGFDFGDMSDIFDDILGGFGFSSSRRSTNRRSRGNDVLTRMTLTFDEAIFGCKKDIEADVIVTCDKCWGKGGFDPKTCPTCHGSGMVTSEQRTIFGAFLTKSTCSECKGVGTSFEKTCNECRGSGKKTEHQTINVTIPAGVDNGNRLRVAEKGEAGNNGGSNGDLYIEFTVKEHELYDRIDDDIYLTLPITITDAVLGAKVEVPTIYGKVDLTIPAGSAVNDKLRLKGKGIENVTTKRKGDMFIILKVIIPTSLTKEQRVLFDNLSKTTLDNSNEFKSLKKYL